MRPVVSVAEMRDIDAAAQAEVPLEALVERAGYAVAAAALSLLGGAYGRRVVVVAGQGNNGADGRVAARLLRRRGVRVAVVDAGACDRLPPVDLVVDAAYGTGFRGEYAAPVTEAPVLAVDIPSGVHGDTGLATPGAVSARATITFAALKPGLLLGEGPERAGAVEVADIGLDCSGASAWLMEDPDVATVLPSRPRESHKWRTALGVVAGAPGMMGAATFCTAGAARAGAGMIRLGVPGASGTDLPVSEAVSTGLPAEEWDGDVLEWTGRCRALVVGPGLGRGEATRSALRRLLPRVPVPVLVDADGLHALGPDPERALAGRRAPTVLTPHDGEYSVLTGHPPGADRLEAARELARASGAVVLLKGSTTVVAAPDGAVRLAAAGSQRLATAGTGDVLSGVVGALLAQGVDPLAAAALGAHVHGRAAALGPAVGLVASDLAPLVSRFLSDQVSGSDPASPSDRISGGRADA